jgi:hypothetical protein
MASNTSSIGAACKNIGRSETRMAAPVNSGTGLVWQEQPTMSPLTFSEVWNG